LQKQDKAVSLTIKPTKSFLNQTEANIRSFRRFYLAFKDKQIQQTAFAESVTLNFSIQPPLVAKSETAIPPLASSFVQKPTQMWRGFPHWRPISSCMRLNI